MKSIDFGAVDAMIFVNTYYAETFDKAMKEDISHIKFYIIPNGIDLDEWPLRTEDPDPHKIALVASMKHVKNIPLAAAILLALPKEYHIHHIGLHTENFTGELFSYIDGLGLRDRWHWDPKIPSSDVQGWLKDKGCLLNPSINEGNPNCVIEAMSMGIKPVIHLWPGASCQFPARYIFKTVGEACRIIRNEPEDPEGCRNWVSHMFTKDNFKMLHQVIEEAK